MSESFYLLLHPAVTFLVSFSSAVNLLLLSRRPASTGPRRPPTSTVCSSEGLLLRTPTII